MGVTLCQRTHEFKRHPSLRYKIHKYSYRTTLVGPNSNVYPSDSSSTHDVGPALLQSQLLAILSRQIMEQDPQYGMTPKIINISMCGMFYNWVLLGGI